MGDSASGGGSLGLALGLGAWSGTGCVELDSGCI